MAIVNMVDRLLGRGLTPLGCRERLTAHINPSRNLHLLDWDPPHSKCTCGDMVDIVFSIEMHEKLGSPLTCLDEPHRGACGFPIPHSQHIRNDIGSLLVLMIGMKLREFN